MNRPDVVTTIWKDGEVWRNDRNGVPRMIRPADIPEEEFDFTTPPAPPAAQPEPPALDLDFA